MSKTVLELIREKACRLNRKIVLTESDDPRNLQAAALLVKTGCARPVLAGDPAAIPALMLLDKAFRKRNVSPGGCADLLAATWFLAALEGLDGGTETGFTPLDAV